jgi:hypothetical protein
MAEKLTLEDVAKGAAVMAFLYFFFRSLGYLALLFWYHFKVSIIMLKDSNVKYFAEMKVLLEDATEAEWYRWAKWVLWYPGMCVVLVVLLFLIGIMLILFNTGKGISGFFAVIIVVMLLILSLPLWSMAVQNIKKKNAVNAQR